MGLFAEKTTRTLIQSQGTYLPTFWQGQGIPKGSDAGHFHPLPLTNQPFVKYVRVDLALITLWACSSAVISTFVFYGQKKWQKK